VYYIACRQQNLYQYLLKEIKEHQDICFKFVPTKDNPADIATRGLSPSELSSFIWWTGPKWLQQHKSQWPEWTMPEINLSIQEFDPDATEAAELKLVVGDSSHIENQQSKQVTVTVSLVDIKEERFSSLLKLIRVTAWVRRFVNKLKRKDTVSGALTASGNS